MVSRVLRRNIVQTKSVKFNKLAVLSTT